MGGVRSMRAVGDRPGPPLERKMRVSLEGRGERPGALLARRAESGRVACWSPVLAQRAVAEDPRWTRAVKGSLGHSP